MPFAKLPLLERYILKNLFIVFVAITAVLLGALWLTSSIHFIEIILQQTETNSFILFLKIALLLLPDLLTFILPFSLFFAVLYVYNRFIMDRELIVMQALGLNNKKLAFPALFLGFLTTLLLLWMNIFLIPYTFSTLRNLEYKLRNTVSVSILKEGEFNSFPGLTLFLRKKGDHGEIYGVFAYNAGNQEAPYTLAAQKGFIKKDPAQGIYLALEKGIRQEIDPKTAKTQYLYFDNTVVNLSAEQKSSSPRPRKPAEFTLKELFFPNLSQYNQQECNRFRSEGHQRLLLPILPFCFVLMVMIGFLVRPYKRTGFLKEIFFIVLSATILEVLTFLFIHLSSKIPYLAYSAYILLFGVISILGYILFRSDFSKKSLKKKVLP